MTKGLNEAKNFIRQFRSLVVFAELIEDLGDADEKLAQRKQEIGAAESLVAKAREDLAGVEAEGRAAKAAVSEARKQAKEIVQAAERKAEAVLAEAAAKCRDMLAAATADVKTVERQRDTVREEVGRLSRAAEVARKEQASLEEELRKFKAKF